MKVKVMYKWPDAVSMSVDDAVDDHYSDCDRETKREKWNELYEEMLEILGSSEYITIEVDTDTKEVKVLKR